MSVLERVRAQEGLVEEGRAHSTAPVRRRIKKDLVDRMGLTAMAQMVTGPDADRARGELEVACESILNTRGYEEVPAEVRSRVIREVVDEVIGLGPIQPLLEDPTITEVMVNGCASLFFERAGSLERAPEVFESA